MGLPSYCYMIYGGMDYRTWSYFIEQGSKQEVAKEKLNAIYNFCSCPQCRHRVLVNYFGQEYEKDNCGACDYCLKEVDMLENALQISQSILSCIDEVRAGRSYGFGGGHIAAVLKGNFNEKIENLGQQHLATFGAMNELSIAFIRHMIEQLVGQGFIEREQEYSTLSVTNAGMTVLSGETVPTLAKPIIASKKKKVERKHKSLKEKNWEGVDTELFQLLRVKRIELAQKERVPAYIIFGDASLKDMATVKPITEKEFAEIYGVGERKLKNYSDIFIEIIKEYEQNKIG